MDILSQKIKEIEKRLTEIATERIALEQELISLQRGYRAIGYRISDENEFPVRLDAFTHPMMPDNFVEHLL